MKIFKNKFFIVFLIVLVVGVILYFVFNRKAEPEYTVATVSRGDLIQTVSETGTVKSNNEIDLNFPVSGKIVKIFGAIGDQVTRDQVIAELDNGDLLLKAREAQANLRVAEANLAKLLAGATAAELAVSQANVDQTKTVYDSALVELEKTKDTNNEDLGQAEKKLNDLYLTSGITITSYQQDIKNYQAVALTTMTTKLALASNALDNINTILNDNDAKSFLAAGNTALVDTTKNSYNQARPAMALAQASLALAQASPTQASVTQALVDSSSALNKTFTALKDCYSMLEVSLVGSSFTQAELDAYKTAISSQQTSISSAISSVQTAQNNFSDAFNDLNNAILTAQNDLATAKVTAAQKIAIAQTKVDTAFRAWQLAQAQLSQLKAGARGEDFSLSQAQVAQAQAALALIQNQINNNIIKAPAAGTITKKNYEVGEQASSAQPVFSILSVNNFEIEVDVSEADINKVELKDAVQITLDAFGKDTRFYGQVSFIEPAETVIQDVIYYKVKINFDGQGKNIKSGMTANIEIMTDKKDKVLIMPGRAVIEKNGSSKFVRLLINQALKEVPVTIGLRGDDGLVEVLAGVKEGDEVVTYIKPGK